MNVLAALGAPAVAHLIGLLGRDDGVEYQAVFALGEIGPAAAAAVGPLSELLTNPSNLRLASFIAEALGRIGRPAVDSLVSVLNDPRARWIRHEVIRVLGNIGSEAVSAVGTLATMLKSPEWDTRADAAAALGGIGPNAVVAVEALTELLDDTYVVVRTVNETKRVQSGAWTRSVSSPRTDLVRVRDAAAKALALIGVSVESAVSFWIEQLKGASHTHDHHTAEEKLSRLGGAAVGLLISLLDSTDPHLRSRSARVLGRLSQEAVEAVVPLISMLRDPITDVRVEAALALGRIGNTAAISPLIQMLEDPDTAVRHAAVRALGGMGTPASTAIGPLTELLQHTEDSQIYWTTMLALDLIEWATFMPRPHDLPHGVNDQLGALEVLGPPNSIPRMDDDLRMNWQNTFAAEGDYHTDRFRRFLRRWAVTQRFTVFPDATVVPFPTGPLVEPNAG